MPSSHHFISEQRYRISGGDTTGNSALNLPRCAKSENDTSEVIKDITTNNCEGEGEGKILAPFNAPPPPHLLERLPSTLLQIQFTRPKDIEFEHCLFVLLDKPVQRAPSPTPKHQYSASLSKTDGDGLLGSDLAKNNTNTALAKKYSLPPSIRKDVTQVEPRFRTHSDERCQEGYDNRGISMENGEEGGNLPMKKLSLANRMENPFYTEPTTKDPDRSLSPIKARYGRSKKDSVDSKEDFPDNNANELPAVKGDLKRKGSVVLVSKSPTGETCFQVQTPSKITKTERTEDINI